MFNEQTVKITKCDNGYVMEWSKPDHEPHCVPQYRKPTSGTEVHNTLKKVMDAAKSRLS